jgi:hypothetical protein
MLQLNLIQAPAVLEHVEPGRVCAPTIRSA